MLIVNPGTRHFDPITGAAILDMADFSSPSTSVASLTNNPAAQ